MTDDAPAQPDPDAAAQHLAERSSPHGLKNRIGRTVWGVVWLFLFRPSPRVLHRWRNLLLRLFGARLHATARTYPRARIWAPWNLVMHEYACLSDDVDCYCVDRVEIGAHATVSQYSYLCGATHDHTDVNQPLVPKPIVIGERVWIAADVFVAPGVTVGDGTVVGARSSVFSDLPPWSIAMGTPARVVRPRELTAEDFVKDGPSKA